MNETITPKSSKEVTQGVVKWAVRGMFAKVVVALILFLSAGRWDWGMGWVYVGVFFAFDLATALVVLPRNPALLAERAQLQEGTKGWDKIIVRLAAVYFPMASWIVAGLNERWGWKPDVSPAVHIVALLMVLGGYGITVWAMGVNAYFSTTVRLQEERGHKVVTDGPYRIVRHPGYVGATLFTLSAPLLLGSVWALIPALLSAIFYVMRTILEDRMLHDELEGYPEYAAIVRYKLLPHIW
ncbi:MAG: isoprenylcysteine carboxylmethyltransferase family protein [Anaerolineae bacterium]|nr:isoprenylcysteine carboxylmethyltransferase family protein [Anaerolineae bacterium]